MLVFRVSPFSGVKNSMELDITDEQLRRWHNGDLIQNVFSHLTADEREFLKTGITKEEWDNTFGEENR